MTNYKQKYTDQVVVLLTDKNNNFYDSSITDNHYFSAIGQETSFDVKHNKNNVYGVSLACVKPDSILNFHDVSIIKIYDEAKSSISNIDVSNFKTPVSLISSNFSDPPLFTSLDKNVTFDNFNTENGMFIPISSLENNENVLNLTATISTPSNVKCNYTTGNHQYIKDQPLNILLEGDIKKGDSITIKRTNKPDVTSVIKNDTDLIFSNFGVNGIENFELVYTPLKPLTFHDNSLSPTLLNATVVDPEATKSPTGSIYYPINSEHPLITVKAKDGYSFENNGTFDYTVRNQKIYSTVIEANHSNTITINIPSDLNWANYGTFNLTLGASKPDVEPVAGEFTNIYKANYNDLLSFTNEAITKITGGKDGGYTTLDLTPYINNLIMIPFDVPSGTKAPIVAGNEEFKTQLPTVNNNFLTIDLGKIEIPEQYKNGFDYYQVKTRLMLPYTNFIELDPMHVINKTISIQYVVNVVNGDTTINVYSDSDLFLSQQVNLANEIPFISKATSGSQYAVINQLKTHFRNEIKNAYIIIEQPTPILNSDYYKTNEKGTLKNYTGNVKAKLLNNIDINSNDLISLQNLLETGVNIK